MKRLALAVSIATCMAGAVHADQPKMSKDQITMSTMEAGSDEWAGILMTFLVMLLALGGGSGFGSA